MDSERYVEILENALLLKIEIVAGEPDLPPPSQIIFQQGNDPKRKSRLAVSSFEESSFSTGLPPVLT